MPEPENLKIQDSKAKESSPPDVTRRRVAREKMRDERRKICNQETFSVCKSVCPFIVWAHFKRWKELHNKKECKGKRLKIGSRYTPARKIPPHVFL